MLSEHKDALLRIAEALLVSEVLDAEQVRRLVAGESVADLRATAAAPVASEDEARARLRERSPIVGPLPPIHKPVPQE